MATIAPGSSTASWLSVGGTSLSTPQWAGLVAVANALRARSAKAPLGAPHTLLYGQIATAPGVYASAFADITRGSDGTCATCTATVGYDPLTGLGTPNAGSLLSALSGMSATPVAPVVTGANISGTVGTALSFTVAVTAANPVTYTLSGAPAGVAISSAGVVTWPTPVAGSYSVTVTARDSKTGLSGQGVFRVTITAPTPPTIAGTTISGTAGTPLMFNVVVPATNPVTFRMTSAPTGMSISSSGVVSWTSPVAGTYSVTMVAQDTRTGLSGQGVYRVTIAAPTPPAIAKTTISGTAGTALTFTVAVTAANPVTFRLTGAPTGMSISSSGVVSWTSPVAGTYSVTIVAQDTRTGLSGQGVYTVNIVKSGLVITAPAMNGVAGKPLTGTITISDPGVAWIQVSLSSVPAGMTFSISGSTLTATWAKPVLGSYSLKVSAVDSAGRTAQATVPIVVAAK